MKPSYVFCLEVLKNSDYDSDSKVLPFLETLALNFDIPNVYQCCDNIDDFEKHLQNLLYEDRNFKDYNILYFVLEGSSNKIKINEYYYSFEEIAELFEGKLTNKIVHFTNTFLLNTDAEEAQYFIDVTAARGISGFNKKAPVLSTVLDGFYFELCQNIHDPIELVETLFDEKADVSNALGFTFYY